MSQNDVQAADDNLLAFQKVRIVYSRFNQIKI